MNKVPIGIDDFKKIIEDNYYFVDKTMFIKEVWDDAQTILITRPRRFGKTLNMSMLKYFFDNKENNTHLFEKLKISNDKEVMKYQGKFPVIFLSFKGCNGHTLEQTLELINEELKREILRYSYIKENLNEDLSKQYDDIKELKQYSHIIKSIYILSELIHTSTDTKPIIIIDEYDNPINNAYVKGFYEELIDFMKPFFENTLKSNIYIEKSILTGILRVSKESIFSGLNNVVVNTIFNNRYSDKFGFLQEEVSYILDYYKINYKIEEVKDYYNGYKIGRSEIFNPWSILNYTDYMMGNSGINKDFWINTSSNDIIQKLIKTDSIRHKKDVEKLLRGESISKIIDENVAFNYLANKSDAPWSLMLFSGYLKVSSQIDRKKFELKIPNKEVRNIYQDCIIDWFNTKYDVSEYDSIIHYLLDGDLEEFEEGFKELLFSSMSFFDPSGKNPENFYHGFVLGLLALLIDKYDINYNIKSNRETGNGRADIIIIPKSKDDRGIIMEFKKSANVDDLRNDADIALTQICDNKYITELESFGVKDITKIGIAFCGKECSMVYL